MSAPNGMVGIMIGIVAGFVSIGIWQRTQSLWLTVIVALAVFSILFWGYYYLTEKRDKRNG